MDPATFQVPNLGPTLGATLIGGLFAAALFGVTSTQAFLYYQNPGKDGPFMKSLVAILWAMDTTHFALTNHALYFYMVSNFANLLALERIVWSIAVQITITNISNAIVQCVFARRVHMMSKGNWPLTILIIVLSLFSSSMGLTVSVRCLQFPLFADFERFSWMMFTGESTIVVADCLIAASLCYFLYQSRTGFKTTDSVLNVLMMYSINTGLLTGSVAIVSLVTYSAMPHNLVYMGVYFVFSKLYFNSLLAALNARDSLRSDLHQKGIISIPMESMQVHSTGTHVQTQLGGSNINLKLLSTTGSTTVNSTQDMYRNGSLSMDDKANVGSGILVLENKEIFSEK